MNLPELLTGSAALLAALLVARHEDTFACSSPSLSAKHSHPVGLCASPDAAALLASPIIASPPPPFTYGRARMIHAPTPCDVPTFSVGGPGAPYFVTEGTPRAGQPFRVDWTTKPTCPGESPSWPAMLLVSFNLSSPIPLLVAGAPGCHLMVAPDFIMVSRPGSILTQSGGCIRFDWTPRPSVVGIDLYGQLLVCAPGVNTGGFLVSPALHVVVGS